MTNVQANTTAGSELIQILFPTNDLFYFHISGWNQLERQALTDDFDIYLEGMSGDGTYACACARLCLFVNALQVTFCLSPGGPCQHIKHCGVP